MLPLQPLFAALVLSLGWRRSRWPLTRCVWLLLFVGSAIVVVCNGVVFASYRTLYAAVPLVVLAAAAALDDAVGRARLPWMAARRSRWASALVAALTLCCAGSALSHVRAYGERIAPLAQLERSLRAVNAQLAGGVVASTLPWSVIATTDSPAVMIPDGDEAAIEHVLQRYGVRWLLLPEAPCLDAAVPTCEALRRGRKSAVGGVRVEHRSIHGEIVLLQLDCPTTSRRCLPSARNR